MKPLPISDQTLLLRTDFSNDAAWASLYAAIKQPSEEGFLAYVDCISDPDYADLTTEELLTQSEGSNRGFTLIADRRTLTDPELPILVLDLTDQPGRIFRVIPRELWGVENNLSLANMDYHEFADCADPDGVFRGFPDS